MQFLVTIAFSCPGCLSNPRSCLGWCIFFVIASEECDPGILCNSAAAAEALCAAAHSLRSLRIVLNVVQHCKELASGANCLGDTPESLVKISNLPSSKKAM